MRKKHQEKIRKSQKIKSVKKEEAKSKKPRKSVVEEYETLRRAVRTAGIVLLYFVITLPMCFSATYFYSINRYGDGPANYSEEEYDIMKEALEGTKQEEEDNTLVTAEQKAKDDTKEEIDACLIEDVGLDIKQFLLYVTDLALHTNGNEMILEAWRTKGSFTAKIIVTIDENFHVINTTRNYINVESYMKKFYTQLYIDTILGGLILWSVVTFVITLLIKFTIWVIKKFYERRERKRVSQQEEKQEEVSKDIEGAIKSDIVPINDKVSIPSEKTEEVVAL